MIAYKGGEAFVARNKEGNFADDRFEGQTRQHG